MPVVILPESQLGIELAKWNKPYVYKPYPKMVYRAQQRPDGRVSVGEGSDSQCGGQPGSAEAFTRTCQHIVSSEGEHREMSARGWSDTPQEALARHEELERMVADAAAHRAHDDRNMGARAKVEADEAEAATAVHVAEVPQKKLARKRKGA